MVRWKILFVFALILTGLFFLIGILHGQTVPANTFSLGTNMSGLADWGTELPFVDLMRNAREWFTKDAGNPSGPWNTEQIARIRLRSDGYPVEIPQRVEGARYPQIVATIWAITDGWSQDQPWEWEGKTPVGWDRRARLEDYTWATPRGVPYEMMVRLMNEHDLDGWVCIPHLASAEYAEEMGRFFAKNLDPGRKLYVEYSNEIWNWMFGQTQWLNKNGDQRVTWPERIVPFVQTALEAFTRGFGGPSRRLVRVAAVQTGWLDVSQRIVRNLKPGTVDAVGAAWYFGLSEEADAQLDRLGARARAADIDRLVRADWDNHEKKWIVAIRDQLVRPLGLSWVFYEGGQHLTAHPFGEEPAYAQALLDIQRSPLLTRLYQDWMAWLATLKSPGEPPVVLMHFSLVAPLSARYGSWGLVENLDQDTAQVPIPKWAALEPYLRPVR